MSTTTVFDSNIDKLKQNVKRLEEFKVDPGFLTDLLSFFGRGSVSKEAIKTHNDLINKTINSYTYQMEYLLNLTKRMEEEGLNNKLIMKNMSDHIEKLGLSLDIQKANIEKSEEIISKHKETIDKLENANIAIQKTKNALAEQNQTLISQNEEQQKTNNTLTAQNEEQQKTIADMENSLQKLRKNLGNQATTLKEQTEKINEINKSNDNLSTQLEKLKATQAETERKIIKSRLEIVNLKKTQQEYINKIKAAQKIGVLLLKNSAKNKLKLQGKAFLNRIAEIKENSNNSIADKEAKIKEITEQHNKEQNEINTQLTNLQATSDATIGELKKELSIFKTEEQLGKEDQEKQKKMLRTVTRVFPLSWNNSKGFNIGNITTQVRGNKPYHANDTIDYYLHTLFKGETPIGEPRDIISSKQVPIRGIFKETSGGKKNRMKKSKKSNKSKNNKTKKQRGKR